MGVDGFLGVRAIFKSVDADGAWEENGGGVGLIVVCLLRAFDGGETACHFLGFFANYVIMSVSHTSLTHHVGPIVARMITVHVFIPPNINPYAYLI